MTAPLLDWHTWAPPLNPPTVDGLPESAALAIADAYWPDDPHRMAALQWEAYAAQLDPTLPVASVSTGAQSAGFSPSISPGEYGRAVSRAAWHRSFLSTVHSAVLSVDRTGVEYEPPPDVAPVRQQLRRI